MTASETEASDAGTNPARPLDATRRERLRRHVGPDDRASEGDDGSRLGRGIIGALGALLGLAAAVAWVLGAYLKVDVAAALSFNSQDGWCAAPNEGVGIHCWGDFSSIRFESFTSEPSAPEAVYPLASRLVRLPFLAVTDIAGFQAALITFVVVSALCVVSPLVWAVRRAPWSTKPLVVTVAGIATAPTMMLLDRGNILALAVPLLLIALVGLVRDTPLTVALATIAAASIKPQFALIGAGLLALHHWRAAALTFAGSVVLVVAPYLLQGDRWVTAVADWLHAASTWSASQPLSASWPNNISLPHVLYLVTHAGPWRSSPVVSGLADRDYLIASVGVAVVVVAVVVLAGRSLPPLASGASLLAVACLVSPLTYAYYAIFMVPVVAVVFRHGVDDWPRATRLDRSMPVLLAVALVLGLSPLLVPLGATLTPPTVSLLPLLSTGAWAVFLVTLAIWGITRARTDQLTARVNESTDA